MYKPKITIGVLPTRRGMLDLEIATKEKDRFMSIIKKIKPRIVKFVDIDDICQNGIIANEKHSLKVVEKFHDANIDAIFIPFCDFGEEGAVVDVASKFDVPVLVWGARDQRPNKPEARGRDTQCGMFAATKVLQRYGVKYSYIFNVPADSDEFRHGFETFIRVVNVIKDLRGLRIGKIGEHPTPFRSVMANEAGLMSKFNIQTVAIAPTVLQLTMDRVLETKGEAFNALLADIRQRMDCSRMSNEHLERLIALKIAVEKQLSNNNCSVAAIECWPTCAIMKMPVCAMIGEMTDLGYPIACETDINGAVTLAILRACQLGEHAEFLADLTIRHPENDNAELLWHCGPFPFSLKAKNSNAALDNGQEQFELKQGHLTLCRFDDLNGKYYLFSGEADTTTGPETTGTYVWIETENWKKWEQKLMFGPYIHHLGGTYGSFMPVLYEVCRYLDIHYDTVDQQDAYCL